MEFPKITLEAARVNAHLTQDEASKRLGICRFTLRKYESGVSSPTWAMVKKMESVYSMPVDFIFLP